MKLIELSSVTIGRMQLYADNAQRCDFLTNEVLRSA
jgi:hypothetical protein